MVVAQDYVGHDSRKVAIIGTGYVGASIAYSLMMKELAREIILIDKDEQKAEAEVLDIRHGIPYMGTASIRRGEYQDVAGADLIIITAGRNRKVGETRLEMAADNVLIAKNVVEDLKQYYDSGVILVASNPVDIITYVIDREMALPAGRVFGTGCILDSSRLVNAIADYVDINPAVINAQVIGEHGESQVPLWSKATIAGIPLAEYCSSAGIPFGREQQEEIEKKVKATGSTIIKGKGKTHFGIATCACSIADAILNKRATITNVCSRLQGEYGLKDVALSLPCIIDENGIERRLVDKLAKEELQKLKESAEKLQKTLAGLA